MSTGKEVNDSSPDLLGRSISDRTSSPAKRPLRFPASTPTKRVTRANSPLKQSSNIQLQDYYLTTPPAALAKRTSPTRSVTRQTENVISPWRIRVRVDAEREEESGKKPRSRRNSGTPSKRSSPNKPLLGHTTTTTIPLKGGDDTPPKRGRGRPRKSDTPAKRPATPKPDSGRQSQEGVDLNGSAKAVSPAKRGRPRKNSIQSEPLEDGVRRTESQAPAVSASSPGKRNVRGRRKTAGPEVEIAVDSDASINNEYRGAQTSSGSSGPTKQGVYIEDLEGGEHPARLSRKSPLGEISSVSPQKGNSHTRSLRKDVNEDDPTTRHEGFDTILEAEDMTMITLNSIPSAQRILQSTGDSVDNTRGDIDGTDLHADHEKSESTDNNPPHDVASSHGGGYSLLNLIKQVTPSQLFSSPRLPPPVHQTQTKSPRALNKPEEGTPKLARVVRAGIALQGVTSSPANSRSEASQRSPRDRMDDLFSGFGVSTRRELRAGLRLGEELAKRQNLVARASQVARDGKVDTQSSPSPEDDVFQTLATGENSRNSPNPQKYRLSLPKQADQKIEYPSLRQPTQQSGSLGQDQAQDQAQGNEHVEYPNLTGQVAQQLPSPENSLTEDGEQMDWQHDPAGEAGAQTHTSNQQPSPKSSEGGSTAENNRNGPSNQRQLTREEELELSYQRERDEVVKQAQAANTSQVIVVNSDDPTPSNLYPIDEDDDWNYDDALRRAKKSMGLPVDPTLDVWQMEALESSEIARESTMKAVKQEDSQLNGDSKRSKLPIPWRKQNQSTLSYGDESSSTPKPLSKPQKKHGIETQSPDTRKKAKIGDSSTQIISVSHTETKATGGEQRHAQAVKSTPLKQNEQPKEGITASIMRRVTERFYGNKYDNNKPESNQTATNDENSAQSKKQSQAIQPQLSVINEPSKGEPSKGKGKETARDYASDEEETTSTTKASYNEDSTSQTRDSLSELVSSSTHSFASSRPPSKANSATYPAGVLVGGRHEINTSMLSAAYAPSRAVPIPFRRRNGGRRSQEKKSATEPSAAAAAAAGQPSSQEKGSTNGGTTVPSNSSISTVVDVKQANAGVGTTFEVETKAASEEGKPTRPPFSIYLPFNSTHYKRLNALYQKASEGAYNNNDVVGALHMNSPLRRFLGHDIESMGWRKPVESWELIVVQQFLDKLAAEGVDTPAPPVQQTNAAGSGARHVELHQRIGAEEVLIRVFSLWSGRIQRGLRDISENETEGVWDERWVSNRKDVLEKREGEKFRKEMGGVDAEEVSTRGDTHRGRTINWRRS